MSQIRVIAICLIQDKDRIFVLEGFDPIKGDHFYRPLGGGVDFGEQSADAVVREFQEELGEELAGVAYLDTLENIFTYKGQPGHEIVLLYQGYFTNQELYAQDEVWAQEDSGKKFKACWVQIDELLSGQKRLVPEQLLQRLPLWLKSGRLRPRP